MLDENGSVLLSCILQFLLVWIGSILYFLYADGGLTALVTFRALAFVLAGFLAAFFIGSLYTAVLMRIWFGLEFPDRSETMRMCGALSLIGAFGVCTWFLASQVYGYFIV